MNKKWPIIMFLTMIVSYLVGCDGAIRVKGRVYESVNASSGLKSIAYIDAFDGVPPPHLVPVKGAEILIEPWSPEKRGEESRPELFVIKAKTDEKGYFEVKHTEAPGSYDATLTVSCAGHLPVERIFKHDRLDHNMVVVLVPEPKP